MATLAEAAKDFLVQKRLAVVGVSRDPRQPANFNFRKLRDAGYEVFPVNPQATTVEGVPCFPDLKSIPGGVDAVLIYTPPQATESVVRECADLGIARVWIHRSIGGGSYSEAAERVARERGLALIPIPYLPSHPPARLPLPPTLWKKHEPSCLCRLLFCGRRDRDRRAAVPEV